MTLIWYVGSKRFRKRNFSVKYSYKTLNNIHYHQCTRPNSKLPSSKQLISGHKWPCAGGKFIYRPAPDWLRRRRTTAIAQSESACKGGASLTGHSSCFLSRTVLTKLLRWRNSEFRRLNMQSEFRFRSRATKRNRAKGSSKKYKESDRMEAEKVW